MGDMLKWADKYPSDPESLRNALISDNERLRESAGCLLAAIDDMHQRGETFTGRVSIAVAAMREALKHETPPST